MVPPSGARKPSTHSIVVVFPAPFGPIRPKISPSWTSNDTSETATVRPYNLRMFSTRTTGVGTDGLWHRLVPTLPARPSPGRAATHGTQGRGWRPTLQESATPPPLQ